MFGFPAHGLQVFGARHLHDALDGSSLDFMVLYSSTAALLGAPGQGNYAAANVTLDAMAHNWRLQGPWRRPFVSPACLAPSRRDGLRIYRGEATHSVQWGPWLSVGMAAQNNSFGRLKMKGLASICEHELKHWATIFA
eukprot:1162013-Amphidinium_carterae.2